MVIMQFGLKKREDIQKEQSQIMTLEKRVSNLEIAVTDLRDCLREIRKDLNSMSKVDTEVVDIEIVKGKPVVPEYLKDTDYEGLGGT